jgi:hypothetical protein
MANGVHDLRLPRAAAQASGLVVLPLKKYEALREKIGRLENQRKLATQEAQALKIIAEGEREYREGKLKPVKSLAELM